MLLMNGFKKVFNGVLPCLRIIPIVPLKILKMEAPMDSRLFTTSLLLAVQVFGSETEKITIIIQSTI